MILDNEQQRQFLLELVKQVNFPGTMLDQAFALKQAIARAAVAGQESRAVEGPSEGLPALGQPNLF
jgi:hypothetical protein